MSRLVQPLLAGLALAALAPAAAPAQPGAPAPAAPPDAPTVQPAPPPPSAQPDAQPPAPPPSVQPPAQTPGGGDPRDYEGAPPPSADDFDAAPPPQGDRERWAPAPAEPDVADSGLQAGPPPYLDTRNRESELQKLIDRQIEQGLLDRRAARRAMRRLSEIRDLDQIYRRDDGQLSPDQRADLDERMTALTAFLAIHRPPATAD